MAGLFVSSELCAEMCYGTVSLLTIALALSPLKLLKLLYVAGRAFISLFLG